MATDFQREFANYRRELTQAIPALQNELRKEHLRLGKVVLGRSQDRMRSAGYKRGGYLGAQGLGATSTRSSASIWLSGSNPRTAGEEFGAYRRRGVNFHPWKGNQWTGLEPGTAGYAVQPVIRESREYWKEAILEALEKALKRTAYPLG